MVLPSVGMNEFDRSPRVLVVEDDRDIADVVVRSLRLEGYEVRVAPDGVAGLDEAHGFLPDVVILDLGLPRMDGVEVARELRKGDNVPILMLTARDALEARVTGLDAGADDYLVKPFERQELLARIRALLRRSPPRGSAPLRVGDLSLNPDTHEVERGERSIELTQREFELLEYLMRNERIVISRQRLLDEVWGYVPFSTTNTIEVFVSRTCAASSEADRSRGCCTRFAERVTFSAPNTPLGRDPLLARRDPLPPPRPRAGCALNDVAAVVFVILCVFGVVVDRLNAHRVRDDFDQQVLSNAHKLHGVLQFVGGNLDPPLSDRVGNVGAVVRVLAADGQRVLDHTGKANLGNPNGEQLQADYNGYRVVNFQIAISGTRGLAPVRPAAVLDRQPDLLAEPDALHRRARRHAAVLRGWFAGRAARDGADHLADRSCE